MKMKKKKKKKTMMMMMKMMMIMIMVTMAITMTMTTRNEPAQVPMLCVLIYNIKLAIMLNHIFSSCKEGQKKAGQPVQARQSILIGFSIINQPIWIPQFLETPYIHCQSWATHRTGRTGKF